MTNHHTKTLGDLGVLKAQLDLFQRGYVVSVPLTEHAPFDLVVTKDGKSRTVQVKTRHLTRTGVLEVQFRSSWNDRSGTHYRYLNTERADIYCVYNPEIDACFYLDPREFRRSVALRVRTPKNSQKDRVNFADDYREVP